MELDRGHVELATATIFTLVFGAHLTRAIEGWGMQFGPYSVPMWASWVALAVAGLLAFHYWGRFWNR